MKPRPISHSPQFPDSSLATQSLRGRVAPSMLRVALVFLALSSIGLLPWTELSAKPPKPRPPAPSGKVIEVRETIKLTSRGKTYDYKGATLVWRGKGDCSQKEGMPPIFDIRGDHITLKNATILGAPDGIHVNAKNVTLERLSFPNVCEDAVTMKSRARDTVVRNCFFAKASDKAIQGTYGASHSVIGNVFVDVSQAFRVKKGVRARFRDNVLYNVRHAVHADGKSAKVEAGKNAFYNVTKPYFAEKGAKISRKWKDRHLR